MSPDARRQLRLSYLRGMEESLSSATWLFAATLVVALGSALLLFDAHQRVLMSRVPLSVPWVIGWASPLAAMLVFVGYMTRIAWVVDRRLAFVLPALALAYVFVSGGGALFSAFVLRARLKYQLQALIKMVAYHDDELP